MKYLTMTLLVTSLICLGCVSSESASTYETSASPANTRADGWVKLGERTVNHRVERDEIKVGVRDGNFRRIKLAVRHRAVNFRDVKVHYANGGIQDIDLRRSIPAGGETRPIDLRGDDRVIEKVVFFYDTKAPRRRGRRAEVQLWGLR